MAAIVTFATIKRHARDDTCIASAAGLALAVFGQSGAALIALGMAQAFGLIWLWASLKQKGRLS